MVERSSAGRSEAGASAVHKPDDATTIHLDPIRIAPGYDIELALDIALSAGAHLNAEAPWRVRVSGGGATFVDQTGRASAMPLKVRVPAGAVIADDGEWIIDVDLTYCTVDGSCVPANIRARSRVVGTKPDVFPVLLKLALRDS